jgi:DNA polymerase III alpha subunit
MTIVRTGYSFRVAVGHLDDVIKRLSAIGAKTAPIADRMSTFGYTRWTKAAKKADLRPIYGVELAVVSEVGKADMDYWTFLAKDDIADVHDLIFLATSNTGREPTLTMEQALRSPGVIKIAGPRAALDLMKPDVPDLYVGLNPSVPKGQVAMAREAGFRFIRNNCNFYPTEDDKEFFRITMTRFSPKGTFGGDTQTYPMHILTDDEWHASCEWLASKKERYKALNNWEVVEASCVATLKKATLLTPVKEKTLRQMCLDGAERLKVDLSDPVYQARLDKELALIEEKKFEDYFYIIADMVGWAKERMVCGPARGSSCGSLVCYLIGITAIDPIPDDLLFERFIDTTRSDLPDIDLDFSDVRRQKVFNYVEEKYGADRVARLGTVGLYKPRSSLHQAGLALRIPKWTIEKVLDNIIERSSGDSRALQQLEDTLSDTESGRKLLSEYPEVAIAGRMEGHPNNASQHAAGVLITQDPVTNYVAVDARTKAAMCDKKDAEELNLLKIDALGLTQLSVFERTLELMGEFPDGQARSGWLEKIPLNDQAAFDVLIKGHFAGIFQFMGGALQSLAKQTKFNHVNDLVAITALARPGPMATGGANQWVRRRAGTEEVTYPHPLIEPYLRDTLGIVVYQEQVMQIAREVGNLSWDDVTQLRRAMSKSMGEEFFNRYGDPWKEAAIKKGLPPDIAHSFWKDLCAFGSWGFNKSHAVAYGRVSYWCCWLKAHHPLEFAAATLDAETDPMKQTKLLRELASEGTGYVAIDKDRSTDRWEPDRARNLIIGPLSNIKGIGPSTMREIIASRNDGKPLKAGTLKKLSGAKTEIDTLYPISDRVKELHPNIEESAGITIPRSDIAEVQPNPRAETHGKMIIGVVRRIVPRDENEPVNIGKREARDVARYARWGKKPPEGTDYKVKGETRYLNLFFQDDTDEILVRVDRGDYERLGVEVVERGRAGKSIYAVKGSVPRGFRMIKAVNMKYLGDMEEELEDLALERSEANVQD